MASLKDIRNRIGSVKKTQKTTSAMKMVSAAKLRRAQEHVDAALPYAVKLREVVSKLSANLGEESHPLFKAREGNKTAAIVVTSDRGLCGAFNVSVCKMANQLFKDIGNDKVALTLLGRKGNDFFRRTSHQIDKVITELSPQNYLETITAVVNDHIDRFQKGELDRVYLFYNHFRSAISQVPTQINLLPVEPPEMDEVYDTREMIFEPSAAAILDDLLYNYVNVQVSVGWLDSQASEHGARMTAMDSATKNAKEMISKLQLYYNRTRQAAITKELIEIVSGAQSL